MSTACIRRHHQLPPLRLGSDVDWVLAGSGSLSSGSARSRAQLIAAQRLDPQVGLFPNADDPAAASAKRSNRWTERKDKVAPGVGLRAQSAGPQQIVVTADNDNENPSFRIGYPNLPRVKIVKKILSVDEQRPRVTSWTTDLDASQNSIPSSQGTFRPLLLQIQSPQDVNTLSNDSVSKGSFTLLPTRLSGRGSAGIGQEKLNQTWPQPTSGRRSPRIPKTSSKRGRRILEPLNGSNPHDGSPRRGVSPARKLSPARRGTSPVPRSVSPMQRAVSPIPRVVSPMPRTISPVPRGVSPVPRGVSPMRVGVTSGGRQRIPPLSPRKKDRVVDSGYNIITIGANDDIIDLASLRRTRRRKRSTNKGRGIIAIEHEQIPLEEEQPQLSPSIQDETDDCTIPQKPMLARQGVRHDMSPAGILHENGEKISNGFFTPPAEPFLPPVEPLAPQISRSRPFTVQTLQDELEYKSLDENDVPVEEEPPVNSLANSALSAMDALEAEERALKFQLLKEQEQLESATVSPISVASAPALIESPVTATEVIELDNNSRGSVSSLQNIQNTSVLLQEDSNEHINEDQQISRPTYTTGSIIDLHLDVEDNLQNSVTISPNKRTRRIKRGTVGTKNPGRTLRGTQLRDTSRTQSNSSLFPESLGAVEKPREALQQCFAHLDSSEWEMNMQGLQLLVRMLRHNPDTIHAHLHSVIVAIGKQVRNLRSQVARAACQACGELFLSQRRALETDLDEIASPLLHRTADTNRFLRADSNAALDKMIEVISPPRAISVIIGKGISHQNAIVRTSSARLLVTLVSKVGVDRVMTHSGDLRDRILITGSNLLTEGSLDTRCFAKQLFRMLSSHPTFNSAMTEVIPPHVLRNISKTLQSLK